MHCMPCKLMKSRPNDTWENIKERIIEGDGWHCIYMVVCIYITQWELINDLNHQDLESYSCCQILLSLACGLHSITRYHDKEQPLPSLRCTSLIDTTLHFSHKLSEQSACSFSASKLFSRGTLWTVPHIVPSHTTTCFSVCLVRFVPTLCHVKHGKTAPIKRSLYKLVGDGVSWDTICLIYEIRLKWLWETPADHWHPSNEHQA